MPEKTIKLIYTGSKPFNETAYTNRRLRPGEVFEIKEDAAKVLLKGPFRKIRHDRGESIKKLVPDNLAKFDVDGKTLDNETEGK